MASAHRIYWLISLHNSDGVQHMALDRECNKKEINAKISQMLCYI